MSLSIQEIVTVLKNAGYETSGFTGYKDPKVTGIEYLPAFSQDEVITQLKVLKEKQENGGEYVLEENGDGHMIVIYKNGAIIGGLLIEQPINAEKLKGLISSSEYPGIKVCLLNKKISNGVFVEHMLSV